MIKKFTHKRLRRGLSLIEVVVATGIISAAFVGLVSAYNAYLKSVFETTDRIKAVFLLEETLEAVRSIRDSSWDNIASLSPGVDYYLFFDPTSGYEATTSIYFVGKFERKFSVSAVKRDVNDDISENGSNDAGTKLISASVSFTKGSATTTKTLETYLTDLF